MAKVFISYKRIDEPFVRQLDQALRDHGHETWVDLSGIPPTAVFMDRIRAGIEGADDFIFVLTPESAASQVCGQEIEHAVRHSKRLIPIVRGDVNRHEVPEAMAERHWIFFREGEDFEASLSTLLHAIATDLEWVQTHTRLTVRANEWERSGRDPSYLLRGSDLVDGEQALVRAGVGTDPQPTKLQQDYVLTSRLGATWRQRATLGAVSFALVVAISLAFLARAQYRTAEERRLLAERRERIADGRRLATEARTVQASNPRLGLLLAAESVLATTDAGEPPVPIAGEVLREALAGSGGRILGRSEQRYEPYNPCVISPAGPMLIRGGDDGIIRIWDLRSPGSPSRLLSGHRAEVNALAVSHDGRWLVSCENGPDSRVLVWDLTDPAAPRATLDGPKQGRVRLAIGRGGRRVVVAANAHDDSILHSDLQVTQRSHDGYLALYDSDNDDGRFDRKTLSILTTARGLPIGRIGLDPGESQLLVERYKSGFVRLEAYPLDEPESGPTTPSDRAGGKAIASSADGRRIAEAFENGKIRVRDVDRPDSVLLDFDTHMHVDRLCLDRAGSRLVAWSFVNVTLLVWAVDEPSAPVWTIDLDRSGSDRVDRQTLIGACPELTADGRRLVMSMGHEVRVWDVAKRHETPIRLRGHEANISEVYLLPDSRHLVTFSLDDTVRLWDLDQPSASPLLRHGNAVPFNLAFTPDSHWLAVNDGGTVRIWNLEQIESPAVVLPVPEPEGNGVLTVAHGGFGSQLTVLCMDGRIRAWEPSRTDVPPTGDTGPWDNLGTLMSLPDPKVRSFLVLDGGGDLLGVHYGVDGRCFAVSKPDEDPAVWASRPAEKPIARMHGFRGELTAVALDGKGRHLVAGGESGDLHVWSLKEPGVPHSVIPRAHEGGLDVLAFSPAGGIVASGGKDRLIRLWSLDRPRERPVILRAHSAPVIALAVDARGSLLASASEDGALWLWDLAELASEPTLLARPGSSVVGCLGFSPDGRWLATGCEDATVRLWPLRPAELVARAGQAAGRNLTPAEWSRYFPTRNYRQTFSALP